MECSRAPWRAGTQCGLRQLLVQPHALEPRREGEAIEAGAGLARRAGGNVVDENPAQLTAFGVDEEISHERLYRADWPDIEGVAADDRTVGAEQDEVELHTIELDRGLVLGNEVHLAAVLEDLEGIEFDRYLFFGSETVERYQGCRHQDCMQNGAHPFSHVVRVAVSGERARFINRLVGVGQVAWVPRTPQ